MGSFCLSTEISSGPLSTYLVYSAFSGEYGLMPVHAVPISPNATNWKFLKKLELSGVFEKY